MIRRLSLYEFYFRISCFLLPGLSFLIAAATGRSLGLITPLSHEYFYVCLTLTLGWILSSAYYEVASVEALFLDSGGTRRCVKAVAWTYMPGLSALFFYRQFSFSRLLLGSSALILLGGVLLLRVAVRRLVRGAGAQRQPLRVIVIGADGFAQQTAATLMNCEVMPCEIVAFVPVPEQAVSVEAGATVLGLEQLSAQQIRHFADEIVIAASPEVLPNLSELVRQLRALAIPIRFCLDLGAGVRLRDRFFRLGGTHILDVQVAPSETIGYLVLKRCFDIAFSMLALAIAALPMLAIILAVKLSSPGPVFFTQQRVGINGRAFTMFKFRTMRLSPPAESDTRWTTAGDERRTAVGVWLRRSSLDELPQFFNVLRGDMSVVGPRPERPHFVEKFNNEISAYNTRHHLKSGITGWAQVNGLRGDGDIAKRVELDLYYLRNWSFFFDLQIIFMTIFAGMFAENAY